MPLLLIGYWKSSLDDDYPFPQQVEAAVAPHIRIAVAAYLDAGALFEQYRGHSCCRYGCEEDNGSSELSDGMWVWPSGLPHYVREHGVSLPPEFMEHATRPDVQRQVPAVSTLARSQPVDPSLWLRWAAAHTTQEVAAAIQDARTTVARRRAATLELAAERLAQAEGLADATCLNAGCDHRALTAKAFCARCLLRSEPIIARFDDIEYEEIAKVKVMLNGGPGA